MQMMPDELKLEKDTLDSYLVSLQGASAGLSEMTVDEVKALFSADGEAVDIDDEAEPADDPEMAAVLGAAEPKFDLAAAEDLDMSAVRCGGRACLGGGGEGLPGRQMG